MWLIKDTRLVRSIYRQSFCSTATIAIDYILCRWLGVEEEVHSERFLLLQKKEAGVSQSQHCYSWQTQAFGDPWSSPEFCEQCPSTTSRKKCFTDLASRGDEIGVGMRDTDTTQSLAAGSRAEDELFPACMIHSRVYHCMFYCHMLLEKKARL